MWVQKSCWKRGRNTGSYSPHAAPNTIIIGSLVKHWSVPETVCSGQASALEPWHLPVPLFHTQDIKAACVGTYTPAAPTCQYQFLEHTPLLPDFVYIHIHLWTHIYSKLYTLHPHTNATAKNWSSLPFCTVKQNLSNCQLLIPRG